MLRELFLLATSLETAPAKVIHKSPIKLIHNLFITLLLLFIHKIKNYQLKSSKINIYIYLLT